MSENVFRDLDIPDAEAHFIKAGLVTNLADIIRLQGMTQAQVAKAAGWSQPRVSQILRGQFHNVSVEKLIEVTNALSYNVRIVIDSAPVIGGPGKTTVLMGT